MACIGLLSHYDLSRLKLHRYEIVDYLVENLLGHASLEVIKVLQDPLDVLLPWVVIVE